ncbi:protein ALP1-like, partial [Aphis craccivora]
MSIISFDELLTYIGKDIKRKYTHMTAIQPEEKLVITL